MSLGEGGQLPDPDEPVMVMPDGTPLPYGGTYMWPAPKIDTTGWPPHIALAMHVGDILLAAASLDATLTNLIAVLVNREQPNHRVAAGRFVNDKIKMLEALYPSSWRDTPALTSAIKRVTQDRNSLAHAFWDLDLEAFAGDRESKVPLILRREKSKEGTQVDLEALYRTRVDVGLLDTICGQIAVGWALGELDDDVSITEFVASYRDNPLLVGWPKWDRWFEDVSRLFPMVYRAPTKRRAQQS